MEGNEIEKAAEELGLEFIKCLSGVPVDKIDAIFRAMDIHTQAKTNVIQKELTRTSTQLDEMVTKYNELSKKYADLRKKHYSQ